MQKRGQFFLIAALVIIAILIGITTIYNVVNAAEEDQTVYDLTNEIDFESVQLLDNGIFNERTENQINQHVKSLMDNYASSNPESDLITIYGDFDQVSILYYSSIEHGTVGVSTGGSSIEQPIEVSEERQKTINPVDKKVKVVIGDIYYEFILTAGQNFYIIVKKDNKGERFVSAS